MPSGRNDGCSDASFSSDVSRIVRLDRGGQSLEFHVDRRDLAIKAAFVPRPLGLLVALERELVRLRPLDSPLLRYFLRRNALRRQRVLLHQRHVKRRARPLHDVNAQRHPRHRFDAAADRDVAGPSLDQVRREVDRLLPAAALPVDGRRRNFVRKIRRQQHIARNVRTLFANLVHAAEDDILYHLRFDPGVLHDFIQDVRSQVIGMHARKRPTAPSHRRPHRLNDDHFSHCFLLCLLPRF